MIADKAKPRSFFVCFEADTSRGTWCRDTSFTISPKRADKPVRLNAATIEYMRRTIANDIAKQCRSLELKRPANDGGPPFIFAGRIVFTQIIALED